MSRMTSSYRLRGITFNHTGGGRSQMSDVDKLQLTGFDPTTIFDEVRAENPKFKTLADQSRAFGTLGVSPPTPMRDVSYPTLSEFVGFKMPASLASRLKEQPTCWGAVMPDVDHEFILGTYGIIRGVDGIGYYKGSTLGGDRAVYGGKHISGLRKETREITVKTEVRGDLDMMLRYLDDADNIVLTFEHRVTPLKSGLVTATAYGIVTGIEYNHFEEQRNLVVTFEAEDDRFVLGFVDIDDHGFYGATKEIVSGSTAVGPDDHVVDLFNSTSTSTPEIDTSGIYSGSYIVFQDGGVMDASYSILEIGNDPYTSFAAADTYTFELQVQGFNSVTLNYNAVEPIRYRPDSNRISDVGYPVFAGIFNGTTLIQPVSDTTVLTLYDRNTKSVPVNKGSTTGIIKANLYDRTVDNVGKDGIVTKVRKTNKTRSDHLSPLPILSTRHGLTILAQAGYREGGSVVPVDGRLPYHIAMKNLRFFKNGF